MLTSVIRAALISNNFNEVSSTYAQYVDDLVAIVNHGASDTLNYAHSNHLFSVAAITDEVGTVIERYGYDAYGERVVTLNDTSFDQPYGFTGRRLDDETGLWYFRARYFDSELGRFIGRDPLGYVDGYSMYSAWFAPLSLDPTGKYSLNQARKALYMERSAKCNSITHSRARSRCRMRALRSVTRQQVFDKWHAMEQERKEWWSNLPKCPCEITIECNKRKGGQGGNRVFTSYAPKNPDPSKWDNPGVPTDAELSLHPGSKYSMRSRSVNGKSNQCTYDSSGKLITDIPGAGTVDNDKAGGAFDPHVAEDVAPIEEASYLDGHGNPNLLINLALPGLLGGSLKAPPGPNVLKYYEVRPLWSENCE